MSRLISVTETKLIVKVEHGLREYVVYRGDCENDAERAESVLDMTIDLVNALMLEEDRSVDAVQTAWEILEVNGHTD